MEACLIIKDKSFCPLVGRNELTGVMNVKVGPELQVLGTGSSLLPLGINGGRACASPARKTLSLRRIPP